MKGLCLFVIILTAGEVFANQVFDFRNARNPDGYLLSQVCYNYDSYISTVKKSKCSRYERVLADDDEKYKIKPRMRNTCVEWDQVPAGQKVPLTTIDCVQWKRVKNWFFDKKSGPKFKCIKTGPVEVPRVQYLDVYNKFNSSPSIGSEDQLMGSRAYIVPVCSEASLPTEIEPEN